MRTNAAAPRAALVSGSARAFMALVSLILLITSSADHRALGFSVLLALVVVGCAAAAVPPGSIGTRLATLLEASLWAVGVLAIPGTSGPLLPYLLAPALAGGLALGLEGVGIPIGAAAVAVLAGAPTLPHDTDLGSFATGTAEWLALAILVGLLASWVQRLQSRPDSSYEEAFQLLGQLRVLTRSLPVGLDAAALAETMLRELQERLPKLRSGAVYTRSPGNLPALRATTRTDRLNWKVDLSEESVFTTAWVSRLAGEHHRRLDDGTPVTLLVLPLVIAQRTVGLVGLELNDGDLPPDGDRRRISQQLEQNALRLETAMLFDELREIATVEERRRLAREIHDGVAQDLAAFGYQLDGLAREARSGAGPDVLTEQIGTVRTELGRLVTELRNSIFELRTEVDQHGGLGAALSDYVRAVGAASAMTVHLSLDERPDRLPSDTEAELLRIAQEAVTNARKHAQADNIWVRCEVDPPRALLVIEDDGVGPGEQREGSFGLEIMKERAERLHASLSVDRREPVGTVVTCRLGTPG